VSDSQYWSHPLSGPRNVHPQPRLDLKRGLDLILALVAAPFAIVILAPAVCLLLLTGRNPFYRHTRIGRDGLGFQCLKLQTMSPWSRERFATYLAGSQQAAVEFARTSKLRDDPRIGLLGRILRRTSIDELPQLWNVIRGEMSLVGPRPITAPELQDYTPVQKHAYLSSRPGLTGLWQVKGRNALTLCQRAELDAEYVATRSTLRDFAILLRTVPIVLRLTGV